MKRYFLVALVACMTLGMWAKDKPKQGFGLQIGWAQPILRLNNPNTFYAKDSLMNVTKLNGFKIGVVYDASYFAGFGSSMGINYTMAGGSTAWQSKALSDYPRQRTHTMYHELEVFVDWQYKFEIAKETYLILYSGPTIQCGIAFNRREDTQVQYIDGNIYTSSVTENAYNRHDQTSEQSNEDLRRLNVTWGVGAGFQYKRYFLRGGYDFGLLNPYANAMFINAAGKTYDRYTRGRLDQWNIRLGIYFWYKD